MRGRFETFAFPINDFDFFAPRRLRWREMMMNQDLSTETSAADAALIELGFALGQSHTFGVVAGRCSAAQAQAFRRLREEKLYKRCCEKWDDFCPQYLKMSRSEADRTIKLLEEFGPAYFELSQLTRISPETFRAIAPNIDNGILHHNGEAIELSEENSRRVAELRGAIPKKSSEVNALVRELHNLLHEGDVQQRIDKLAQCCFTIVSEFEKISRDERLGITRVHFQNTLGIVRDEMVRVAVENGL